jgi:predicted Zn-dependent protease
MQEEFFTDAILVLQQALKQQPSNRAIRTMLAQIYNQVGPPILISPLLK